MANLLRHLNTRRVDINYLKLVIQGRFMVKPNVQKGEAVHFLVRCCVNAEMKKNSTLCMSTFINIQEMLPMQNAIALLVLVAVVNM